MNVLIVGSGAREYSFALSLSKDDRVTHMYFYPGNGATTHMGTNIRADEMSKYSIDIAIIGPEAYLMDGLSDALRLEGIKVFGPSKKAAELEGSKVFSKAFMSRHNIPTPGFASVDNESDAIKFIDGMSGKVVLKASGLCAGKGVLICEDREEAKINAKRMLSGELFGEAGKSIVIEEFIDGKELSIFVVANGEDYVFLPSARDHKKAYENDMGANTGGMGAYAPAPLDGLESEIRSKIIEPTLKGMVEEGRPYEGVLFIGIILDKGRPMVLEYNVRFGDPECEVILPLLKTPFLDLVNACVNDELRDLSLEVNQGFCVAVILAAKNYPESTKEEREIFFHGEVDEASFISYAGVILKGGKLFSSGGRILAAIGISTSLEQARKNSYKILSKIHCNGTFYREDIALN